MASSAYASLTNGLIRFLTSLKRSGQQRSCERRLIRRCVDPASPRPSVFVQQMDSSAFVHGSDALLKGLCYDLRYVGCIGINTSMKQLNFEVRSALAKECIYRVCEAANMISISKGRKIDKATSKIISGKPILEMGGQNVQLFISAQCLKVLSMETGEVIFYHPIAGISFVSGGEQATAEFVAYIAKTEQSGRRCYVFECGCGQEKEVIATIGQAFALRFELAVRSNLPEGSSPQRNKTLGFVRLFANTPASQKSYEICFQRDDAADHLCNLSTAPTGNGTVPDFRTNIFVGPSDSVPALPNVSQLSSETWYHGRITREQSRELVKYDGQFLVRQHMTDPNQFVLTGMQNGQHKHLLLIDKDGQVRTKDKVFESISHLIQYHMDNRLPITSAESSLLLRYPVSRM